jgi:hypothetical protein
VAQSATIETADGAAISQPVGNFPAVVGITGPWVGTETITVSFTGALVAATGTVTLDSGAAGSVDGILVNSIEIMSGAEAFVDSLSATAAAVAANITANTSVPDYNATSLGPVITITAVTTGPGPNTFTVVSSATTITTTDVDMAGGAGGVQTTGAVAITAGNAEHAAGLVATALDALNDTGVVRRGSRIELTPVAPATLLTIDSVVIG